MDIALEGINLLIIEELNQFVRGNHTEHPVIGDMALDHGEDFLFRVFRLLRAQQQGLGECRCQSLLQIV